VNEAFFILPRSSHFFISGLKLFLVALRFLFPCIFNRLGSPSGFLFQTVVSNGVGQKEKLRWVF